MNSIPVRLGYDHACPYVPGRWARMGWVDPHFALNRQVYSRLGAAGFRRSGDSVYRPYCRGCSACIPVRIPAADFVPDRAQTRIWRMNRDVCVVDVAPEFSDVHYQLYQRYQQARHYEGPMASSDRQEYLSFLRANWSDTVFKEFRLDGELLAVAVTDRLEDGLSAVYTFFDPRFGKRSPGILAVLHLIAEARRVALPWCYLGYWVGECRKMRYKERFRPLEARIGERWIRFEKGSLIETDVSAVL